MCKAAVPFPVGLSPFLLGWLLSLGMTITFAQMGAWPYIVVGPAVLTLWMVVSGMFGFRSSKRGMALTMLCINPPALVVLVLLGVQELSLHAYWGNAVGPLTQSFHLLLPCPGVIAAMWTGQVFWFYFGALLPLVPFS